MTSGFRAVLSWLVATSVVVALLRVALVVRNGEMLRFRDVLAAPVEALVLHALSHSFLLSVVQLLCSM